MLKIVVSVTQQQLALYQGENCLKTYAVATAKNGVGQLMGSECTPLGKHQICQKIGDQAAVNSVFVARQPTGELYSELLANANPNRDWILTRILWLEGLEAGFNRGNWAGDQPQSKVQQTVSCDTRQRFIYIHGCPDSHPMQVSSSHGCIKMRNTDIIELFELVSVGTVVTIQQ